MNNNIYLALYDFASKQEYIYRTSKIKEISGASILLDNMYRTFAAVLEKEDIHLQYTLDDQFRLDSFCQAPDDGTVLYDGGGNLMVLWKTKELYRAANRVLSVYLLKEAPGLTLISCGVPCSGDFKKDKGKLYAENTRRKNRFSAFDLPTVTPFTQIDSMTFLPVSYKRNRGDRDSVYPAVRISLSSDRCVKANAYQNMYTEKDLLGSNDLEEDKGMLAVIYIDGNAMGNKLMACNSPSYDEGVAKLRSFSAQVNSIFVTKPVEAIRKENLPFRQIIGGGDEITLICRAEDALTVMQIYFEKLTAEKIILSDQEFDCTSCAGIAVFHAKAPFNVAYDIAEAACEATKKLAHAKDGNYFSFYYCHAGITNSYDMLHGSEQSHASGKPYAMDDIQKMYELRAILNAAGRANVKALGNAAQVSPAAYRFEVRRVNAYLGKDAARLKDGDENEKKMVYDMAEFYDLWFAKGNER